MLLRTKPKATGISSPVKGTAGRGAGSDLAAWELRPGGMLVQKRNSDSNQNSIPVPTIKVKVNYGSSIHEIHITPHASFGELKKMLAGSTGLHPQDQKLIYKDKERDSKAYLDVAGVKDGSKLVLTEDVISRERRFVESLKDSKIDKASKEIKGISLEVDKLAKEVSNLEADVCCGKRVAETVLLNLIESLMTQLIKLDGIIADGDVKLQRRMQVKRVQKYIETLDMLKARNSKLGNYEGGAKVPLQKIPTNNQTPTPMQKKQPEQRNLTGSMPVVVTTKWETFDSAMGVIEGTI
ncbi:hypothetical protein LguiA_015597 [Lonicera macranthoides]